MIKLFCFIKNNSWTNELLIMNRHLMTKSGTLTRLITPLYMVHGNVMGLGQVKAFLYLNHKPIISMNLNL